MDVIYLEIKQFNCRSGLIFILTCMKGKNNKILFNLIKGCVWIFRLIDGN